MTHECRCISYNRPDLGGDVPEIVVTVPHHIRAQTDGRDTVCLDLCIAPLVLAMWARGIPTLNSCCGHRGYWDRAVIVDKAHAEAALAVAVEIRDPASIGFWPEEGPLQFLSQAARAMEGRE